MTRTDGELMRATKSGDTEAFAELVERWRAQAVQYASRFLGDQALAEDATQDCFAKVYLLRDRYREEFSFEAYLRAMLHNRCLDLLRMRGRRAALPMEAALDVSESASPEARYIQSESRLALLAAIDRLEAAERELLLDFAYHERTYRELAEKRRVSVAIIKARLHRIRKKLRKAGEQSDEDLS